jgi:type II secretory pathway component PulK
MSGSPTRRREGVVLALVLVLALLLSVSMISFTRRAVIDTMIIDNRDDAARAAALARGGLRLAVALLIEDRLSKNLQTTDAENVRYASPGNTQDDLWNQVRNLEIVDALGGRVRLEIRDSGGRLNLNAVVPYTTEETLPDPDAEEFLTEFLRKVIDEMPIDPGEKLYDPARDLARNLVDYMDENEFRASGGSEDDYYQSLDPPRLPANRPLLSVEELGLVEGFDVQLVESIRPYVTVYPIVEGKGINLNTAPPHVLGLIYSGMAGDRRLVDDDTVARILGMREEGRVVCTQASPDHECVTLGEVDLGEGSIFPPPNLPDEGGTFTVRAHAKVGEIQRTIVAVYDREDIKDVRLLFWRMQ